MMSIIKGSERVGGGFIKEAKNKIRPAEDGFYFDQ